MDKLQNAELQVVSIDLVDKGKEPNTWKEYAFKVKDYETGVFYSMPIKKADGTTTQAYATYKLVKDRLDEAFINDQTVKVRVAYSEREGTPYTHKRTGELITPKYRAIRFVEFGGATKEVGTPVPPPVETPIEPNIDNISF